MGHSNKHKHFLTHPHPMITDYTRDQSTIFNMDPMAFHLSSSGPPPPPPLTQPPPQIFGPYIPDDSSTLHPLAPDFAAHMFPSDHMFMDEPEGTELKKRRISRACDMCRKKKIKCDGKLPACAHCINYKTDCVFTQTEKKRAPPKGAKYIEGLENRLGRMEHLLRLSGLLDEDEDDLGALEKRLAEKSRQASLTQASGPSTPFLGTPAQDTNDSPESSLTSPGTNRDKDRETDKEKEMEAERGEKGERGDRGDKGERDRNKERKHKPPVEASSEPQEDVEALSEMMCSLVTNQSGESRYIGSSSGFSIFSPQGVQWINSKTGDDSFRRMISHVSEDDHKWTNWKPQVFGDLFQRPVFRPLPSKEEALSLLSDYFANFNCMLPLFHQPTFMHLVERQYSSDPYQGTGWWASLNVTLAIAHRLRVMSGLDPAEEDEKGWAYLKNAMSCFSELTMRSADLLSVQALLGMALFLQGTPNPQPVFLLIAAAIRLSHSIGLHKKGTGFNLNPIEIEQRKRVFWIAYMLDKDLCLRSGQPPAQDDDDMSVELPDADAEDSIGIIPLADGKGKMSLFRVLCEFAIIESNVYKRLYSAKASRQSEGELLHTIGELDEQLEEWKERIPIEFRPEHPIQASHTPLILHVVMLHFSYYNCLTTIHRMSIQHGMWTSRLANYAIQGLNARPLNPRVFSSAALCTSAARASIALLQYIPQGDFSCVWMILYFPVSALVTLFANILQNPLEANANSDCKLMTLVVTFLSMLGHEAEQGGVHRMLGVCSEFCRVAESVVEKAQNEHSSRRKRKNPEASGGNKSMSSSASASSLQNPPHQNLAAALTPQTRPVDRLSPASAAARASPYAGMTGMHSTASQPGSSPSMDSSSMGWTQDYHNPHEAEYNQYGYGLNGTLMGSGHPSPIIGVTPHPQQQQQQQPLIPADLFSLQMSLDWNWAEMSGGAYPSVENGNFTFTNPNMNPVLQSSPPQHHQHQHQHHHL